VIKDRSKRLVENVAYEVVEEMKRILLFAELAVQIVLT